MGKIKYSQDQKDKIRSLYQEGLTYKEIGEIVGMSVKAVSNQCVRMGITNRIKKKSDSKQNKICKNCHRQSPNNAKFCWNCGADIRTDGEILEVKLETLFKQTQFLPESNREEYVDLIREIREFIVKNRWNAK